jgi:acyl-[acyl-carrier-protein]-phospholipid O-acyltransferase/long-chain-fatty-acid--[acyl-carrier-protein] ligase
MASGLNRFLMRFVHYRVLDLSEPATVKRMVRLLDAGGLLVMFPQGRVTATASGMKLYHSVATIATRSGAPIVPVTLNGLLYSKYSRTPGDFPRQWLPRVTIRVFSAVRLPDSGAGATRLKRRKAAEALSAIMQSAPCNLITRRETLFEAAKAVRDIRPRPPVNRRETYAAKLKPTATC